MMFHSEHSIKKSIFVKNFYLFLDIFQFRLFIMNLNSLYKLNKERVYKTNIKTNLFSEIKNQQFYTLKNYFKKKH
jgi:hypothetical protein